MDATLNAKLEELGLSQRGVLTPTQKMLAALDSTARLPAPIENAKTGRASTPLATVGVEGTSSSGESAACAAGLCVGSALSLVHDVEHATSAHAVMLLDESGRKLGYLPENTAEIVLGLLRARKTLSARVAHIDAGAAVPEVSVTITLHEN